MTALWELDDAARHNFSRARVVKVDDSKSQQMMNLAGRKNQKPEEVWRINEFGSRSNPPKDADVFLMAMGGRSDRFIAFDGGHEKYTPKNLPEGGKAIFNHTGDIVRIVKDDMQIVHAKKVNIALGNGYDAGQGSYSGKSVSIAMDQNGLTVTFDNTSVKLQSGKVTVTGPKVVVASPDVRLGSEAAMKFIKFCDDSCSTVVRGI